MRKAIHIECAEEGVTHLHKLVEVATCRKLISMIWGKQVKLSSVISSRKKGRRSSGEQQESSNLELDKARSYAVRHTNYNASLSTTGLVGIYDLDKEVEVYSVTDPTEIVSTYTLRAVSSQ